MPPLVSVIIPACRPDLVEEAKASVARQTYPHVETIVEFREKRADDTATVVADKIARGVARSQGKYLIVLCDDDELAPTYCEKTVACAERTNADVVYTDVTAFGEKVNALSPDGLKTRLPEFDAEILRFRTVMWMTFLITRDCWEAVGGMDGTQPYMDWDIGLSLYERRATVVHLKEPLYRWRDHGGNGSRAMNGTEALRALRDKWPVWRMPDSEEASTVMMAMQAATPAQRVAMMEAALAAQVAPVGVRACA